MMALTAVQENDLDVDLLMEDIPAILFCNEQVKLCEVNVSVITFLSKPYIMI